ncbi:unnamed protein product [Mytilus edulis]|uniref:Uncharacterized protein n=1 Tax=Mytilus edulis TaxID=6550 RepID=A0A8S3QZP3_MYTED|nr:unnamed protein product [Mytilus edulis]
MDSPVPDSSKEKSVIDTFTAMDIQTTEPSNNTKDLSGMNEYRDPVYISLDSGLFAVQEIKKGDEVIISITPVTIKTGNDQQSVNTDEVIYVAERLGCSTHQEMNSTIQQKLDSPIEITQGFDFDDEDLDEQHDKNDPDYVPSSEEQLSDKSLEDEFIHSLNKIHNDEDSVARDSDTSMEDEHGEASNILHWPALEKSHLTVYKKTRLSEISCQKDETIVALGESWLRRSIDNREKRRYYTSQHMRLMGKMLLELRSLEGEDEKDFEYYLHPSRFDMLVGAALQCCLPYMDDMEELKAPSNGIKIKYDLRRMITARWAITVKKDVHSLCAKRIKDLPRIDKNGVGLNSYASKTKDIDDLDESLVGELSKVELHLLKSQDLMKVRGKGNRPVPVLIPADLKGPLDFLASSSVRKQAGIPEANCYLFPVVSKNLVIIIKDQILKGLVVPVTCRTLVHNSPLAVNFI